MKKKIDLSKVRSGGRTEVLLSGIFRCPITQIDVYTIERWNGLQTVATSFTLDVVFQEHVYQRRVQLFHPFGIYPFPQYKVDSIKQREKEGWKGFLLSVKADNKEIEMISSSFIEYPQQNTLSMLEFVRLCEETRAEMREVKEDFSCFIGRKCLIQVVDAGAKDHTGNYRNFPLNQFLCDEAGKEIFQAYKNNLKNDFSVSDVGAGIISMGYGGGQ